MLALGRWRSRACAKLYPNNPTVSTTINLSRGPIGAETCVLLSCVCCCDACGAVGGARGSVAAAVARAWSVAGRRGFSIPCAVQQHAPRADDGAAEGADVRCVCVGGVPCYSVHALAFPRAARLHRGIDALGLSAVSVWARLLRAACLWRGVILCCA